MLLLSLVIKLFHSSRTSEGNYSITVGYGGGTLRRAYLCGGWERGKGWGAYAERSYALPPATPRYPHLFNKFKIMKFQISFIATSSRRRIGFAPGLRRGFAERSCGRAYGYENTKLGSSIPTERHQGDIPNDEIARKQEKNYAIPEDQPLFPQSLLRLYNGTAELRKSPLTIGPPWIEDTPPLDPLQNHRIHIFSLSFVSYTTRAQVFRCIEEIGKLDFLPERLWADNYNAGVQPTMQKPLNSLEIADTRPYTSGWPGPEDRAIWIVYPGRVFTVAVKNRSIRQARLDRLERKYGCKIHRMTLNEYISNHSYFLAATYYARAYKDPFFVDERWPSDVIEDEMRTQVIFKKVYQKYMDLVDSFIPFQRNTTAAIKIIEEVKKRNGYDEILKRRTDDFDPPKRKVVL